MTYYYVAGAIKVGANVNFVSNRTTAAIPLNAQAKASDSAFPLCEPDDSSPLPAPAKTNH